MGRQLRLTASIICGAIWNCCSNHQGRKCND
jgi:hypothetical protein